MECNRGRHQLALGLVLSLVGLAIALAVTTGLHTLIPAEGAGAAASVTPDEKDVAPQPGGQVLLSDGGKAAGDAEVDSDDDNGVVSRRTSGRKLQDEARTILGRYEDAGNCVLVRAGYLDLLGQVWSCTVQGDGWVDACVVSGSGDVIGCEVTTLRMDSGQWERSAEDAGLREVASGER